MVHKSSKLYVGMDVHKESIDIAVADEGGEVRHHGQVGGDMNALWRAVRKLESLGRELVFVYEAGPCGFGVYRGLIAHGHACWVVALCIPVKLNSKSDDVDRERRRGAW